MSTTKYDNNNNDSTVVSRHSSRAKGSWTAKALLVGIPCLVCRSKPVTGKHYNAYTCDGCKAFFGRQHRASNAKRQTPTACKNDNKCDLTTKAGIVCQDCRLRACTASGMIFTSKNGTGRYRNDDRRAIEHWALDYKNGIKKPTPLTTRNKPHTMPSFTDDKCQQHQQVGSYQQLSYEYFCPSERFQDIQQPQFVAFNSLNGGMNQQALWLLQQNQQFLRNTLMTLQPQEICQHNSLCSGGGVTGVHGFNILPIDAFSAQQSTTTGTFVDPRFVLYQPYVTMNGTPATTTISEIGNTKALGIALQSPMFDSSNNAFYSGIPASRHHQQQQQRDSPLLSAYYAHRPQPDNAIRNDKGTRAAVADSTTNCQPLSPFSKANMSAQAPVPVTPAFDDNRFERVDDEFFSAMDFNFEK